MSVAFSILNTPVPVGLSYDGIKLRGWKPIKWFHKHEPDLVAFFQKNITKDMVVADVGANVGYYTVLFSRLAKQVHAYEPDPASFERLKWAVHANRCPNVVLHQSAVGEKDGYTTLKGKLGSGKNSVLFGEDDVAYVRVETMHPDVQLAKIDVEGSELSVLRGMQTPIPCTVELAPKVLDKIGSTANDFLAEVRALGYVPHAIDLDGSTSSTIGQREDASHGNIYLTYDRRLH